MPGPSTPPNAPRPPTSQHDEGDLLGLARLRDYVGFVLRATWRHRWLSVGTFLCVVALALVALKTVPKRWQVQAALLAQRSQLMGTLSNPGMNRDWDAPARSAREVLLRRDNVIALCKRTGFVERYLATRAPAVRLRDWVFFTLLGRERSEEQLVEGLVDAIQGRLWVNSSPEGTVTITFEWSDRALAFDVVQTAVQSFLEERHVTETKMVSETIAILEGHDAKVQKEIATTVAALDQKMKNLRIRVSPRLAPTPSARSGRGEDWALLDATLAARRRVLADMEEAQQRRQLELQSQLAQELGVYAPRHPAVLSTRSAIEAAARPSPQLEALRLEVQDLERRALGSPGGLAGLGAGAVPDQLAAVAQARLDMEDPRLEAERNQLDLLLRQHSNLLERIAAARVELDTAQAVFKYRYSVVTPPQLPRAPAKPYTMLFLVGGVGGGLALALFVSAVADLRTGRVLERWQVERELDLPVVGVLRR